MMNAGNTKVLYIAGWGRSGTTIMDRCLGQTRGFFSCGEVRYIWDRGLLDNRVCSCGRPFRECDFWGRVAGKYLGASEDALKAVVAARDGFRRRQCRKAPLLPDPSWKPSLAAYVGHLGYIVDRLAVVSGARVFVDSSKFPSHGYALGCLDTDLRVVHLVRDPRAVAYSWQRRKAYDHGPNGTRYIERKSPIEAAVYWRVWNSIIERLWASGLGGHYLRVRYEDFVSKPRMVIERIIRMTEEEVTVDFFKGPHMVFLEQGHLAGGNPARFRAGAVELRPDNAWQDQLPAAQKLLVTSLCWPLMKRYGYLGRASRHPQKEGMP